MKRTILYTALVTMLTLAVVTIPSFAQSDNIEPATVGKDLVFKNKNLGTVLAIEERTYKGKPYFDVYLEKADREYHIEVLASAQSYFQRKVKQKYAFFYVNTEQKRKKAEAISGAPLPVSNEPKRN